MNDEQSAALLPEAFRDQAPTWLRIAAGLIANGEYDGERLLEALIPYGFPARPKEAWALAAWFKRPGHSAWGGEAGQCIKELAEYVVITGPDFNVKDAIARLAMLDAELEASGYIAERHKALIDNLGRYLVSVMEGWDQG